MNPEESKTYIYKEMVAVFSSVGLRADIKDSCQFIFYFFANVEKHFIAIRAGNSLRDTLTESVSPLNLIQISRILGKGFKTLLQIER
jgi:hypothetical protein